MKTNLTYMMLIGIVIFMFFSYVEHDKKNKLTPIKTEITHTTNEEKKEEISIAQPSVNISKHIGKQTYHKNGISFDAWYFREPLLPNARLLSFRKYDDLFWFSGNDGFISFNPKDEQWYHLGRNQGLPGDTAYSIEHDEEKLLLEVFNWTEDRALSQVGNFHFYDHEFHKTNTRLIDAKNNGISMPKANSFRSRVTSITQTKNKKWFTYRGKSNQGNKKFLNGGVLLLDTDTQKQYEYTTDHGLASAYCNSITSTGTEEVWVSHWHEELGLSKYNKQSNLWEVVKTSINGIELGGVSIRAQENFLFIAQQRGLVIYDTTSGYAYFINESDGLPGYIVADIQFDDDQTMWATAYSSTGKGQNKVGLIKLNFDSIKTLFVNVNTY